MLQAQEKLLTNYEVLSHLGQSKQDKAPENLATITFQLQKYLQSANKGAAVSSDTALTRRLRTLQAYDLEKIEKIMVLNAMPRKLVELHVLIEECDQRFTQEQLETLLQELHQ